MTKDVVDKSQLDATRQYVEVFTRGMVVRGHSDSERRLNEAVESLNTNFNKALSQKAGWHEVSENFASQTRRILRVRPGIGCLADTNANGRPANAIPLECRRFIRICY